MFVSNISNLALCIDDSGDWKSFFLFSPQSAMQLYSSDIDYRSSYASDIKEPGYIKKPIYGFIDCTRHGNIHNVSEVVAAENYGPTMYMIAMQYRGNLAPDWDGDVSPAAANVWRNFYENPDVIAEYNPQAKDGEECLSYIYSLKSPIVDISQAVDNYKSLEVNRANFKPFLSIMSRKMFGRSYGGRRRNASRLTTFLRNNIE